MTWWEPWAAAGVLLACMVAVGAMLDGLWRIHNEMNE